MVRSKQSEATTSRAAKTTRKTPFPNRLPQPALRALAGAGYDHLEQFTSVPESALEGLHGFSPKALVVLKDALGEIGLSFAAAHRTSAVPTQTRKLYKPSNKAERLVNPKVDRFLSKAEHWRAEFEKLRNIALDCQLTEELKWGQPCYTLQNSNIVLIHGFKEYCAYLFFKGALFADRHGVLIQQTENVQSARQIRFTNVREIVQMETVLKDYIHQAIAVEKAGLKVEFKKTADFKIPEEFQNKINESPALKVAFEALTPGRQRAYLFHFSAPKQSKTRESRIEKCTPQILHGKGLND